VTQANKQFQIVYCIKHVQQHVQHQQLHMLFVIDAKMDFIMILLYMQLEQDNVFLVVHQLMDLNFILLLPANQIPESNVYKGANQDIPNISLPHQEVNALQIHQQQQQVLLQPQIAIYSFYHYLWLLLY